MLFCIILLTLGTVTQTKKPRTKFMDLGTVDLHLYSDRCAVAFLDDCSSCTPTTLASSLSILWRSAACTDTLPHFNEYFFRPANDEIANKRRVSMYDIIKLSTLDHEFPNGNNSSTVPLFGYVEVIIIIRP